MDDCFLLMYHNKTLHGRLVVLATCVDVSKTSTLKVGVDTQHVLHGCSLFSLPPSQSEPSNLCPAYWTGEFSGNAHDRETHEKSRWRIAEIHVDVWEGTILIPGDTHMTPRYPLRLELCDASDWIRWFTNAHFSNSESQSHPWSCLRMSILCLRRTLPWPILLLTVIESIQIPKFTHPSFHRVVRAAVDRSFFHSHNHKLKF